MRDDTVDQFTAHELTRGELQALMARSDGPGLVRAAWHLGALAVTGTLLWTLRSTAWVVPLIVVHGYTTPSTTPIRRCHFTPCPACTSGCAARSRISSQAMSRPPSR